MSMHRTFVKLNRENYRSSTEGEDKIEQLYIHYSVEGYASQQAPSNAHLFGISGFGYYTQLGR